MTNSTDAIPSTVRASAVCLLVEILDELLRGACLLAWLECIDAYLVRQVVIAIQAGAVQRPAAGVDHCVAADRKLTQ